MQRKALKRKLRSTKRYKILPWYCWSGAWEGEGGAGPDPYPFCGISVGVAPSDALVEGRSRNGERDYRYPPGRWVGVEPSGDAPEG